MWSPEGRKQNAKEADVSRIGAPVQAACGQVRGLLLQPESDNARQLRTLRSKLEDLRARGPSIARSASPRGVVKDIGVVGLQSGERARSLSAWLKRRASSRARPSAAHGGQPPSSSLASQGVFGALVTSLLPRCGRVQGCGSVELISDALEPGAASSAGTGLNQARGLALEGGVQSARRVRGRRSRSRRQARAGSAHRATSRHCLGGLTARIRVAARQGARQTTASTSIDELAERDPPYIALKDTRNVATGRYPGVRCVEARDGD